MIKPALPAAFMETMKARLGSEYPAFESAMNEDARRGIRLNPLKPARSNAPGILKPVPWESTGYYLSLDSSAGSVPLHELGAWYIQDPAAMVPAAVLNAQPGENVLDLCAAPGGKATQSGLRMKGQGILVCNDPVPSRAQILSRNIERLGITNALVTSARPQELAARWPGGFDAIQVDAPCSGEGMFRKYPDSRLEWTADSPAGCASRQAEILDAASVLLRKGGRLVYSTCTLNRTENEDTVQGFLERHPDFRCASFELPGISAPDGMFTFWPHRLEGEGQFIALLIKGGSELACLPADISLAKPSGDSLRIWQELSGKTALKPTHMLGSALIHIPFLPDVSHLKLYRCGLHLGEVKGRFAVPDHAWALAFERPAFPVVSLDQDEISSWLQGETLNVSEDFKGWYLTEYQGLIAGWGKASSGQLKNHYPKGLRRKLYLPDEAAEV